jgi:hypothetical protein
MHSIIIQLSFQIFNSLWTKKYLQTFKTINSLILYFLFIYIQLRDTHIFVKNYFIYKVKRSRF